MNITKKTAFGATAAAAALVVVGIAGPAMASDTSSKSYGYISHSESPVLIAPEVSLLNGDNFNELLNAANGNAVASGNDIQAPIASGNDTAIGSGNDTAVGNVSDVANGNDVSTDVSNDVSDVVDNVTDVSDVSGSADDNTGDVSNLTDDILSDIDLGSILGR